MKRIKVFAYVAVLTAFALFFVFLNHKYYPVILMYHSIDPRAVENTPAVEEDTFRRQLEFMRKHKFKVIGLKEMSRLIKEHKSTKRKIVITFDDGDYDNLKAAKILKRFGYPAVIFMIVNNVGKKGFLSRSDLRYISKNTPVSIGSHTLNHLYVPEISYFLMEKELVVSKMKLEDMTGAEVDMFSFPAGGYTPKSLKVLQAAGYTCAVTTNRGDGKNVYALRRIKISNKDKGFRLWFKLSGFYDVFRRYRNPY